MMELLFDATGRSIRDRIKMVARMKERFPILARQPRPEVPQPSTGRGLGKFLLFKSVDSLVWCTIYTYDIYNHIHI
jgi:hypothetical protein